MNSNENEIEFKAAVLKWSWLEINKGDNTHKLLYWNAIWKMQTQI